MKFRGSSASYPSAQDLPWEDRIKPYLPYLVLGTGIFVLSGMLAQDVQKTKKRRSRSRKK